MELLTWNDRKNSYKDGVVHVLLPHLVTQYKHTPARSLPQKQVLSEPVKRIGFEQDF